jgi:Cys-tRNA(Pro) deacylase
MAKDKYPVTPAIRLLRQKNVDFVPYEYDYEEKGGTRQTATILNVDENAVIKTLVFETDARTALIVLMHGDCEVSQKELARIISVKTVSPASSDKANKLTGYVFGGTSPFGTRTSLPVYCEETILELDRIYINGGKQGFIICITPNDLRNVLSIIPINVAIKK